MHDGLTTLLIKRPPDCDVSLPNRALPPRSVRFAVDQPPAIDGECARISSSDFAPSFAMDAMGVDLNDDKLMLYPMSTMGTTVTSLVYLWISKSTFVPVFPETLMPIPSYAAQLP